MVTIAQDPAADEVLASSPFALLTGMLLDQQYPMEHAFRGPHKILQRFGTLDPEAIAAADPNEFAELCSTPPAIHRYGKSMAGRVQQLARVIVDEYDGDAARVWTGAKSGADLMKRLQQLPGYGEQKARIFTALLAKQFDVKPRGWTTVVGDFGKKGYRSVADVVDAESLAKVRQFKKAKKAALATAESSKPAGSASW
ncbi:MAG TPA: HhH-GPD-type base excision DNA repair protein [Aeromicrobium sp.]|nr:HhH-GPD-type base excision DNA repair protein [Aeromicrobium sp.]